MPGIVAEHATAPLADLASLESVQQIVDALHILEEEESGIDDALTALVQDKDSLETLLDRIDGLQPAVDAAYKDATGMAGRVEQTAAVAERISRKVRQLDLEQVRVSSQTQSRYSDTATDMFCSSSVSSQRVHSHGPSCSGPQSIWLRFTVVGSNPAETESQAAIISLSEAVERRDWETATRHMQRAMSVDDAIVKGAFAEAVVVRSPPLPTLLHIDDLD
jgi:hypothetical protein